MLRPRNICGRPRHLQAIRDFQLASPIYLPTTISASEIESNRLRLVSFVRSFVGGGRGNLCNVCVTNPLTGRVHGD